MYHKASSKIVSLYNTEHFVIVMNSILNKVLCMCLFRMIWSFTDEFLAVDSIYYI